MEFSVGEKRGGEKERDRKGRITMECEMETRKKEKWNGVQRIREKRDRVAKKRRENKQENRTDGEMRVCKKKEGGNRQQEEIYVE